MRQSDHEDGAKYGSYGGGGPRWYTEAERKSFGRQVGRAIDERRKTRSDVARDLKMSRVSLYQWLDGVNVPGLPAQQAFVDLLGFPLDWLDPDKAEKYVDYVPEFDEFVDEALASSVTVSVPDSNGEVTVTFRRKMSPKRAEDFVRLLAEKL